MCVYVNMHTICIYVCIQAQGRCLFWALVRLPSSRNMVYKYFVAPQGLPVSDVCWEGTSCVCDMVRFLSMLRKTRTCI